jgi:hypothetical protein
MDESSWQVGLAYPKRIRQRDGNDSTAVSSVSAAYQLRIQSEYVKGMETTRRRYQAYRLRISCVSTVRSGSTRQTDRLRFGYDRRLSSFQAPIEPTMAPVASPVVAGLKGCWKGAGNSRKSVVIVDSERWNASSS